ncbi:uncharacterized protein LOC131006536 [Salvia miltiorrhiza]|uniref:uncharacterized protein LOC131006536 n=1 Tax=Salvia miltiorrhiza TaxID=226208 RepID=UPI0025AD5077|nr:uncharacterized protein LOC131006536 [Salvia miltiorrhiza]
MGTVGKAKKELEELYLGVPDESVNLTFQDLAQLTTHQNKPKSPLSKLPSIDFPSPHHHHRPHHHHHDETSVVERGGRRRPGIPHSNICALCCNYIYICRHRCLVCGRVYCRQCVSDGMGEMTQGRKCIDCLGRRFSQRYIHKAGNMGWCMAYPSVVKQQELKWAERGARRSGENRYQKSAVSSRSRSPVAVGLATPSRQHSNPPSFVINSPYNSPTNHHPMPF